MSPFLCLMTLISGFGISQAKAAPVIHKVDCPEIYGTTTSLEYFQSFMRAQENFPARCKIKIGMKAFVYPRRSIAVTSQGHFLITVEGSEGKPTRGRQGSHSFYILPSDSIPTLTKMSPENEDADPDKTYLRLEAPTDYLWKLGEDSNKMSLPSNCIGKATDPQWKKELGAKQSGIEIESCKNKLIIDAGWQINDRPELRRDGYSEVRIHKGSCKVKNSLIYDYGGYGNTEISIRYHSGQDWYDFLKSKKQASCNHLDLEFLIESENRLPSSQPAKKSPTKIKSSSKPQL